MMRRWITCRCRECGESWDTTSTVDAANGIAMTATGKAIECPNGCEAAYDSEPVDAYSEPGPAHHYD